MTSITIDELKQSLTDLDTAAFCDADKSIRVMSSSIAPLNDGDKLIGFAKTVRCHEDFLSVIEALATSNTGDALIVDTQGSRRAVVGELFSLEAARRGLAGIVVDGACRDIETISELSMPVYAREITPLSGTVNRLTEIDLPVICGEVEVRPGEIIFGDNDGVIVMSQQEFQNLLPIAQTIKTTEQKIIDTIENGHSLMSVMNLDEHLATIRRGEPSELQFLID